MPVYMNYKKHSSWIVYNEKNVYICGYQEEAATAAKKIKKQKAFNFNPHRLMTTRNIFRVPLLIHSLLPQRDVYVRRREAPLGQWWLNSLFYSKVQQTTTCGWEDEVGNREEARMIDREREAEMNFTCSLLNSFTDGYGLSAGLYPLGHCMSGMKSSIAKIIVKVFTIQVNKKH